MSDERFNALRKRMREIRLRGYLANDRLAVEIVDAMEEVRQLAELAFDQARDIAQHRLPPLERGAAHLKGED